MIRSGLCDHSDACIVVKWEISAKGDNSANRRNKKLIFKNNAPFRLWILKTNNKCIDIIMPMSNLLGYSDNNCVTPRSLWKYYRDEVNDDVNANNDAGTYSPIYFLWMTIKIMTKCCISTLKTNMLNLKFQLQKVDETRNCLLDEIKHNDLISEKHKKICKYLNYFEHLLSLASTVTGCVSVCAFTSLAAVQTVNIVLTKILSLKTLMVRSDFYDHSDAHIVVKWEISVKGDNIANRRNKMLIFKDNAPFRSCILKTNNTFIEKVEDLDIVIHMHDLLGYSDNDYVISSGLWNYYRDEINDDVNENNDAGNYRINNNKTMKSKPFENFWKFFYLILINCKIELDFSWSRNCVISKL